MGLGRATTCSSPCDVSPQEAFQMLGFLWGFLFGDKTLISFDMLHHEPYEGKTAAKTPSERSGVRRGAYPPKWAASLFGFLLKPPSKVHQNSNFT